MLQTLVPFSILEKPGIPNLVLSPGWPTSSNQLGNISFFLFTLETLISSSSPDLKASLYG